MFDEFDPGSGMFGALGAMMAGAAADDNLSLASLSRRQPALCARLVKFDFVATIEVLSGLLVLQASHAASYRIEALIHLAAIYGRGTQRPTLAQCRQWLNEILVGDALGRGEDPVEDVFVTNIPSIYGNGRIFEGCWEDAARYLTDLTGALLRLRGRRWADHALTEVAALVRLSEAVAQKAGVARYTTGEGLPRRPVPVTARSVELGAAAVTFTAQELSALKLAPHRLAIFEFTAGEAETLASQTLGHTALERRPLVFGEDRLIVALPTAISAAARRHILETAQAAGDLKALEAELQALQLQDMRLALRNAGAKPQGPPRTLGLGLTAVTGMFDEGCHAIAVLVSDDLAEALEDGLQGTAMLMTELDEPVGALERELAGLPGYRRGLTFVVRGGVGRGYAAGFGEGPPSWWRAALPLGDLFRLSWDHDFSVERVWKVLDQEEALAARKYTLVNMNGFLNLYGYLEQSEFAFIPEQSAAPSMIMLATDYVAPLRIRLRQALDQHLVLGPDRTRWVEVQRRATDAFFREARELPLYVGHADAAAGRLMACIETATRPWWVELGAIAPGSEAGDLAFRIWDAMASWLVRLAPRLETELTGLPAGPLSIRLEFPEIAAWNEELAVQGGADGSPNIALGKFGVVVATGDAALRTYSEPTNIGERRLIAVVAQGMAELAGQARPAGWAEGLAGEIVGSDEARFVHAIPASSAQEMVQAALKLPRPRLVEDEDIAWSRLGLAAAAGHTAAGPVETKKEGALLQAAVLQLWERIRARLETLDRRSVVERAILNHEAVDKDRAEWRHTAAALLAVYRDQSDVVRTHNERESARAAAGTTSRALAEMAVCVCPAKGGLPCTNVDLDGLIADLTVMLDCAGQCDAYYYGLAEAPLRVAPNGAFVFDLGFLERLHLPYLYAHQERAFRDGAEDYAEPFERSRAESREKSEPVLPEDFEAAWHAEFGMSPQDLISFVVETAEAALDAGKPIMVLPRSEVLAQLASGERQAPVDAERAFASLSLRPRALWNEPEPQGFKARDWQPWRMNRRLALIRRPLVQLDDTEDPLVVITPGLLDRTVRRALGALEGRLPAEAFDTKAMDRWIGRVVDKQGHAFNHRVAEAMETLGFKARPDVLLTQLGGAKHLGDVDVLAWSPQAGEVWLIECKRLLMDRTVGEIGERLADYTTRGKRNGKRTPIQKHLDRIDFLKASPAGLTALTGVAGEKLLIRSALVTDSIVPMQFTTRMLDLVDRVADFRTLAKVFGTTSS